MTDDDRTQHYRVAKRFFAFLIIISTMMSFVFLLLYLLGDNQWIITVLFAIAFGLYATWVAADISVSVEDSKYKKMLRELGKKE